MRIVIDLQAVQSPPNGARGIGRYSSSLVQAMLRQPRGHHILLALNGSLPSAEGVIQQLSPSVNASQLRIWYPPTSGPTLSAASRRASERLYEAFLASFQPDIVHVSSLFEGQNDACVTSIDSFAQTPTSVTLYDLIPLLYPHVYLSDAVTRGWYMRKVEALRRANLLLAISQSSRDEAVRHLGLDADRCINISTAADSHFVPVHVSMEDEQALRGRFGLLRPFVMYTGGIDHRKNIEGLIRAYAALPGELREKHQLAIVCSMRADDREKLRQLAAAYGLQDQDIVLTGYVKEEDLVYLYNLCTLFVFPSRHEGFGLPALEAMQCGAPVIASNSSSLPEVVGRKDALFNPYDDRQISAKMAQALTDSSFLLSLKAHGPLQARQFSWDATAARALDAFEALHEAGRRVERNAPPTPQSRPRLAFISPLPPERSGIAGYSAELLPALAKFYDVYLISELSSVGAPDLAASFPIRSVEWLRSNAGFFDRVVYQFGDSTFHRHMFDLLREIPGVVVLHDFFLSNIHGYRELVDHEPHVWTRALYRSHGYGAVKDRFELEPVELGKRYPVNLEVVQQSLGVIVHSSYAKGLGIKWYGPAVAEDWAVVPLTRATHVCSPRERSDARRDLSIPDDQLLVCSFGLIGPAKLNDRLIEAWIASSLVSDKRCRLVFVGENDQGPFGATLERRAHEFGIEITGWSDDSTYEAYLCAADVAVQLRTHSRGESSAALLDAMNHGLAVIVNANGAMSNLELDSVSLLPDDFANSELTAALELMRDQPEIRNKIGARARQVIVEDHAPAECARQYADAIEKAAASAALGRPGLVRKIGYEDPPSGANRMRELAIIAQAISQSLPKANSQRQLLIDVTSLDQHIDASVRVALKEVLQYPPTGWRVELVRTAGQPARLIYARHFALALLDLPTEVLEDEFVDFGMSDVLLTPKPNNSSQVSVRACAEQIAGGRVQPKAADFQNLQELLAVLLQA